MYKKALVEEEINDNVRELIEILPEIKIPRRRFSTFEKFIYFKELISGKKVMELADETGIN